MIWLLLAGYAFGWLGGARYVTLAILENDAQRELGRRDYIGPRHDDDEPLTDGEDRAFAMTLGALSGLFWPLILAYALIAPTLRSPTELAYAQRLELERLKRLAAEHHLPMGDEPR